MALTPNEIHQGDCIEQLGQVEPGSIDLAFADPPFNIGYEYDVYDDRRAYDDYLDWSRKWMAAVAETLKSDGTFWLAIGDEYAAELKLIAQNDLRLSCRSWVIWYYTFGVNCKRGFSRSHTHLFHFVKDPLEFTFNADNPAVRVPSARQLVYADRRANPKGRLPDNTWILRPQDAPESFTVDHDTWYYARVAGTFKEREGFHGCQMPEQLLGRIVRSCSNPQETVLDPFAGSGTTLAVAKKLGRQWLGFELSDDYVKQIGRRLKSTQVGDPLDGVADPLSSAPSTAQGRRITKSGNMKAADKKRKSATKSRAVKKDADFNQAIVNAYTATHNGCSVDQLLADRELNDAFVAGCKNEGLKGCAAVWNHSLMALRKMGKLPRLPGRAKTLCTVARMDPYSFAAEIALHQMSIDCDKTLDDILCDPQLAEQFDAVAKSFAPGHTSFEYRWAALSIRKRAKEAKKQAQQNYDEWVAMKLPRAKPLAAKSWDKLDCPGVYILCGGSGRTLYVGETLDIRARIEQVRRTRAWKRLAPTSAKAIPCEGRPIGLQSFLIHGTDPVMNSRLLLPEFEDVA